MHVLILVNVILTFINTLSKSKVVSVNMISWTWTNNCIFCKTLFYSAFFYFYYTYYMYLQLCI